MDRFLFLGAQPWLESCERWSSEETSKAEGGSEIAFDGFATFHVSLRELYGEAGEADLKGMLAGDAVTIGFAPGTNLHPRDLKCKVYKNGDKVVPTEKLNPVVIELDGRNFELDPGQVRYVVVSSRRAPPSERRGGASPKAKRQRTRSPCFVTLVFSDVCMNLIGGNGAETGRNLQDLARLFAREGEAEGDAQGVPGRSGVGGLDTPEQSTAENSGDLVSTKYEASRVNDDACGSLHQWLTWFASFERLGGLAQGDARDGRGEVLNDLARIVVEGKISAAAAEEVTLHKVEKALREAEAHAVEELKRAYHDSERGVRGHTSIQESNENFYAAHRDRDEYDHNLFIRSALGGWNVPV